MGRVAQLLKCDTHSIDWFPAQGPQWSVLDALPLVFEVISFYTVPEDHLFVVGVGEGGVQDAL